MYICTLKKHLQSSHKKENDKIQEEFKEEKNFITIYKKLVSEPKKFPFIVLKNSINYSVYNQEISTSFSSAEANNMEKFNQSINYFNITNQNSPRDLSSHSTNVFQFMDELKNCFSDNMNQIKDYLDFFKSAYVNQNYVPIDNSSLLSYVQILNNCTNKMPISNLNAIPFHGFNNFMSQEQKYFLSNMMLINHIKSIFSLKQDFPAVNN